MNRERHWTAVAAITIATLLLALPGVGRAATVTFSLLADTTTAIPGGTGSFTAFTPDPLLPPNPCISLGNIGFFGAGAGGQQGIYMFPPGPPNLPPGPPTKVADLTSLIPGGTGMFTGFFPQLTISGSTLAVLSMGLGQQGVYMFPPGPPTKVADLSTLIPGGSGSFTAIPTGPPSISGSNVVFLGEGSGGQMGVYVMIPPGPPAKVADLMTAIPDGTGMFTGFSGSPALPPGPPSISGGTVAFLGAGMSGQAGVYVAIPPGPPNKVADTTTVIPDALDHFTFFNSVAIEGTAVAFAGGFIPPNAAGPPPLLGVYVALPPGPPDKVADSTTAVPGGIGTFFFFGNVAIDPQNVVFEGFSDDGAGGTLKGLYTNITGTLTKIIAVNDVVGGKTVSDLSFGAGGFSGDQVVFAATFTDGSQGITLATFSGARCPHSQGFWKNNPGLWPVTTLTLGSQSYTQTELLKILGTSTTSDASLILARQLIAAKLNVANGSDPAPVASTISDADARLGAFAGKLPYNVKSSSPAGRAMTTDANVLANYNTGVLTPNCTP